VPAEPTPGWDLGELRKDFARDRIEADSRLFKHRPKMPVVPGARTVFQGILCCIAVLACLYVAQDIVLPVVLALVLELLLQPLVSFLESLHLARPAGAVIALAVLLSVFVGLGMLLSSPTAQWVSELP
jgi:predicted PurR-regulated permease PerM